MKKAKLTPYQKIVRSWNRGTGCRLTFEDVRELARDHAIFTAAQEDDARYGDV